MDNIGLIKPSELAEIIKSKCEKVLIVDARTFCEYNTSHILNAVNVWCSKIRKKRLQQSSISVYDFLQQACHISLQEISFEEVVVYDQCSSSPHMLSQDTFLYVLLIKLTSAFKNVRLLQGGFLEFQSQYYEMCEDSSQKGYLLTSFSQPCLPVSTSGPTKILPFLFLGSQHDANNKQLLLDHNISYELNVSTSCPKPEFVQDSHFLRIAVNDNFSAKLLPYFGEAFQFIEKVREVGGRVLVHCLAGISRSPTVVISYVMKYFHMHYDEAYRYVKTRRPTISPNINFVGQLLEFDLHLFGKRALMRSPLRPIPLEENFDLGLSPSSATSTNSPLLKSSSSSCISSGSPSETGFPFPLNRSLPSLRLNKSIEEAEKTSSDFDCFIFEQSYKSCTSGKLPSSPVSSPSTPLEEPHISFEKEPEKVSEKNIEGRRSPCSSVNKENEGHINRGRGTSLTKDASLARNRSCRLCEKNVPTKKDEDTIDGSQALSLTIVKQPSLDDKKIEGGLTKTILCNKSHTPPHSLTHHAQLKRESSAPESSLILKEDCLTLPPKTVRSCSSSATSRKLDQHNIPQLPRSYSSSETYLNTRMRLEKQQVSPTCPVSGSNTRKSFSSDEVGKAFQGTCSSHVLPSGVYPKESYTNPLELVRCDSWSTSGLGSEISDWDSVQGDIQSVEDAQGPFDAVFAEVFPGETLGSCSSFRKLPEIRKLDEKTDKAEPKICLRKSYSDNQNSSGGASRKCCTTLLPPDQDSLVASPAPRPVSLPGVSGTYNIADSNPSSDMGVEFDDHRDWLSEDGDKAVGSLEEPLNKKTQFPFDGLSEDGDKAVGSLEEPLNKKTQFPFDGLSEDGDKTVGSLEEPLNKKTQFPFDEHPPVNTKTMGEDVKHFKKDESSSIPLSSERKLTKELVVMDAPIRETVSLTSTPDLDNVCSKTTKINEMKRDVTDIKIPLDKTVSSTEVPFKQGKNVKILENEIGFSGEDLEGGTTKDSPKKESLHERWQWWDSEFKKKIKNIKKNVCLSPWDTNDEGDDDEPVSSSLTGFHLAQELMQSMEDLLEREISDIKKRASSLSTKFGLPQPSEAKIEGLDLIQSSSKNKTCPSSSDKVFLDTVVESAKKTNIRFKEMGSGSHGTHVRSRSEPPSCIEESLYRVKSCPGITNSKVTENSGNDSKKPVELEFFRLPRLFRASSKPGHPTGKRYSCSALDFVINPVMPTFESCPDVSRTPGRRTPESLTPSSSFNRLLKVS